MIDCCRQKRVQIGLNPLKTPKLNIYMEAYRSGHNGPDSKPRVLCDGAIPEKPDSMQLFGSNSAVILIFILQFSHTFANK